MKRLNKKLEEITGKGIELIIISPLNRTLQTAYNGLKGIEAKRECNILCCERTGSPASKGYNYEDTKKVIEKYNLNAELIKDSFDKYYAQVWADKDFKDTHETFTERLEAFYEYLSKKTETNIAVVCHSVFIDRYMRKTLKMGDNIEEYTRLDNCRYYMIKHV